MMTDLCTAINTYLCTAIIHFETIYVRQKIKLIFMYGKKYVKKCVFVLFMYGKKYENVTFSTKLSFIPPIINMKKENGIKVRYLTL